MPFTFNGIGTKVYGGRGYVKWDHESYDAVEWFVILFIPIIPLKDIHVFGSDGFTYRQIPIRPTPGLLFASICKGFFVELLLFVAPVFGISIGFIFLYCFFYLGTDFKKAQFLLYFALCMALLGGLAGLLAWAHRAYDKRHRQIRLVLGPHQFGSSDPFAWTDEFLRAVRSPKEMFGTDSFASAVIPLLNHGQFSKAMWAARFSAAFENPANGEALTDSVLQDLRVQQAIELVLEDRNRWPAVMTNNAGTVGQPQAAEQAAFEDQGTIVPLAELEEIPQALPVENPIQPSWEVSGFAPATPAVERCRHCGLGPVEPDVPTCPFCRRKHPNPGPL